jgi:pyruvate/2-oxoglutarate dehydrogenase complex dihydrolipoamide dehydrogenase (E3) component
MESAFDFVIIGAGASGEAAAHLARARGASVAIIDRDLFGGSCPFWACMPSKTLLHAAEVKAHGGDYPWQKASDRRDYMINRIKTE